jgi:hypothetical protein
VADAPRVSISTVILNLAESAAAVFVPLVHVAIAESAVVPFVPYFTYKVHGAVPDAVLNRTISHENLAPTYNLFDDNLNNDPLTRVIAADVDNVCIVDPIAGRDVTANPY